MDYQTCDTLAVLADSSQRCKELRALAAFGIGCVAISLTLLTTTSGPTVLANSASFKTPFVKAHPTLLNGLRAPVATQARADTNAISVSHDSAAAIQPPAPDADWRSLVVAGVAASVLQPPQIQLLLVLLVLATLGCGALVYVRSHRPASVTLPLLGAVPSALGTIALGDEGVLRPRSLPDPRAELDKVRRWGQKVWDEAVTSFAIQKTANMVDEVTIELKAGKGGDGKVSFRKEKFVPKGGPDGGDGGRGGHIILKGSRQWNTLQHLRNKRTIAADDGEKGGSSRRFGADAKDVIIHVPLGTEAVDVESGKVLAEIMHEGEEILLLRGGKGGWGNERFKTSIRQAPMFARPGDPGEEAWVRLELKLLGDVGLVGLPNAGKSTLLSSISAAKPKIAAYPFTTLSPNLGVVPYKNDQSFTVADIPGIIEGASCGKGLGTQFLKHIERNTMLLFLVAADEEDIAGTYRLLLAEVEAHNPELLNKPRLLVVSKGDLIDDEMEEFLSTEEMPTDCEHLFISSATGKGIEELKDKTFAMLQKAPRPDYVVLTKTKKSDDGVAETLSDEEEAAFPDVEALV